MIAKCTCQFCGQHIEFEVEHAGTFIPCPSCGKQTRLLMPGKKFFEKQSAPTAVEPKEKVCPCCQTTISRKARICIQCGEPFPENMDGAVIGIFAAVMFIIGSFFLMDGLTGHSDNIMQQSYFQAREGFGLILMSLAALTVGILRLIRK